MSRVALPFLLSPGAALQPCMYGGGSQCHFSDEQSCSFSDRLDLLVSDHENSVTMALNFTSWCTQCLDFFSHYSKLSPNHHNLLARSLNDEKLLLHQVLGENSAPSPVRFT